MQGTLLGKVAVGNASFPPVFSTPWASTRFQKKVEKSLHGIGFRRILSPSAAPKRTTHAMKFTLKTAKTADGMVYLDIAELEAFAVENSDSDAKRNGFPRFSVHVDGEILKLNTKQALRKLFNTVSGPVGVDAFRNAGHGVTIKF
jgi:hypothetical protein